jgi:methylenetetrahydrofolate dehydrogenase (NADP+)/methenyltetrahydrofolate cyclohydrolase
MIEIDGKKIAFQIIENLKKMPVPKKFLAIFVVGNNLATESFIKQKEKVAKELGVDFRIYRFDSGISNDQLREKIRQVVFSSRCGGAILQLPLSSNLNYKYVANIIPPNKDIDLLSERMIGSFYNNRSKILPPSVSTIVHILKEVNFDINLGKKVAIVGSGALIGKPAAVWFLSRAKEVFVFNRGSDFSFLKEADLVILGVGQPKLVKANMLKRGAGVIDFGYGFDDKGKVCGDFDADSLKDVKSDYLSFYTPTPKGTGPILVACLFENFYTLLKEYE